MYRFDIKFPCGPRQLLERSMCSVDDYEKHMPNVTRERVVSREERDGGGEEMTVEFCAESAIPAIARPFMKRTDIMWEETFVIDHEANTVDWRVKTPVMTEYVNCSGTSRIYGRGGGSRLEIEGTLVIDPPRERPASRWQFRAPSPRRSNCS